MRQINSASSLSLETSFTTARRAHALSHRLFGIALACLMWCLIASLALAQDVNYTQNTVDANRRSDLTVDATTLGLGFELTLRNYPERAGSSLPINLSYSSKLWRIDFQDIDGSPSQRSRAVPKYAEHSESGWTTNLDPPELEWLDWMPYDTMGAGICMAASCPQDPYQTILYVNRLLVHMTDGSGHELRKDDTLTTTHTSGGVYYAVDGSQMRYDAGTDVLYLADGSRYLNLRVTTNGIKYINRNGNTLTYNITAKTWTDTLGRVISRPRVDNSQTGDFDYVAKGVGGANLTYTLRWRYLSDVRTDATQALRYTGDKTLVTPMQSLTPSLFVSNAGGLEYICSAASQTFNPIVLYQIVLPHDPLDPTPPTYTFTYNVWGEIDKVVYPTGGYERFRYAALDGISQALGDGTNYTQANRGVVERWVSPSGSGTDEAHWVYSATNNNLTTPYTVTTTAPDGSRTEKVVYSQPNGDTRFGFEHILLGKPIEERVYSATGQMLRRSLTEWTNSGPLAGGEWSATRDARAVKQVDILLDAAGGQALYSVTTFAHDADLNVKEVKRYGYQSVSQQTAESGAITSFAVPTTPLRTEETTYLVNDTGLAQATRDAYRARNLLSLQTSTRVKNGAGTIVAQSKVTYDEAAYPLLTNPAVTGWTDPLTTVRGNATTQSAWLDTTNTWLSSHVQYDQCGNVRKAWDAEGNLFEVIYSSTYKYAYPTGTISPDPDGTGALISLTTNRAFDLTSGAVTSQTDANGQVITMEYAATDALGAQNPLRRLTKVNFPDGGSTAYAYGDQPGALFVETQTALDASREVKARREFDGLGRPWRSALVEGATSVYSQMQYDLMGRVWKTSNPYRIGQAAVWTTTTYDALSRVLSVKTPDNAVVTASYGLSTAGTLGQTTTWTDQAGKQRKSVTDALGNLVEVYEDPAGLNYLTTYAYDTLGNFKTATQGTQTRTFVYDSLSRLTSATNPESGTITYQYDDNGNLKKRVDPRFLPGSTTVKVETTYTYDALNRLISRAYNESTPDVTYMYDAATVANSKGRLTRVSSSVSAYDYTAYDEAGRVTASTQTTSGQTYQMSYAYDLAGNLTSQTYPSGRVVTNTYDDAGRLSQVSGQKTGEAAKTYASTFSYWPHGAVSDVKLGNNLWEHANFNNRLQPTEIGLGTVQDGVQRLKLNYTYGTTTNNGSVQTQIITVPTIGTGIGFTATQSYTYDELKRLEMGQEANGAIWKQTFIYDRYGNRNFDTANTTSGYVSSNLTVNPANNRYNPGQGQILYDAAGNLIKDYSGHSFGFDGENRQTTYDNGATIAGGASYSYDGDGRRVKKVTGGISIQTTIFVYNALGQMVAEYDDSAQQGSGGTSYLTSDTLGTPRVITGSSGAVKARHDYLPFGEEIGLVGGRTASNGYVADDVRQKFTGYERDGETGLDYAQARYYSLMQGRFTSADPLMASAHISNPRSWNRYSYVQNDPVNLVDPSGLSPEGGCSAEFSYSQCGGDAGFWGGGNGFGDRIARLNQKYAGLPSSTAKGLRAYIKRVGDTPSLLDNLMSDTQGVPFVGWIDENGQLFNLDGTPYQIPKSNAGTTGGETEEEKNRREEKEDAEFDRSYYTSYTACIGWGCGGITVNSNGRKLLTMGVSVGPPRFSVYRVTGPGHQGPNVTWSSNSSWPFTSIPGLTGVTYNKQLIPWREGSFNEFIGSPQVNTGIYLSVPIDRYILPGPMPIYRLF